ncbi:sucrose phosphorylase [Egicoccus sp. AB-alg2]|uniref:sucrose phosphorylase n=1 Tax=Egicoccus sp. AB-alg2 TaxID=3242693 RepID=UPI00359CD981
MRRDVQLITYVDRLAGDLAGLRDLLSGPLKGLFGGVHLLPFYDPIDGADAGFDPVDHREVDPRLGSWADVEAVGTLAPIMADLIVNHVSSDSPQFRDVLANGAASPHASMFLTMDRVFPDGVTEAELLRLYRPRPGLPFTTVTLADRTKRLFWTTFTSAQMDVDVSAPTTRAYHDEILDRFAAHGITMLRLDAVGYAVKTPGTSSFMTPETFAFIDDLAARARQRGLEVLVEIHSYWRTQVQIAQHVDWVYDFALPPLVLHALYTGDADRLRRWCRERPRNAVTVLDTHDGIGVIDVGPDQQDPTRAGLLTPAELDELVEGIHDHSGGASRQATGAAASNVDLYQVNCTFYDALGRDDDAYLVARLVQFFLPGVPQVYYVGLLAGHNDLDLLHRTGVGRDINRHHYTRDEVERDLQRPVVAALCQAIRLRNSHPAFGGTWELLDGGGAELAMRWRHGDDLAELTVDVANRTFALRWSDDSATRTADTLAELTAG